MKFYRILGLFLALSTTNTAVWADNDKRQIASLLPPMPAAGRPSSVPQRIIGNKQNSGRYLKPGDAGYAYITNRLPSDFPIPLIPGGKILGANDVVTPGGHGYYVRYRLLHDSADVVNWYRQALANAGWKFSQAMPTQDANGHVHMSAYQRGMGVSMMVARCHEADGRADVIINVTMK